MVEAFKSWTYQRPTALCTPPEVGVRYMTAIRLVSLEEFAEHLARKRVR